MTGQSVLRVVSKLLIPFIMLFGLYVQFHGDFGAGGGFQAGVIFATAFVLYDLVFGDGSARAVVPPRWLHRLAAIGVLLYGGVGVYSLLADRPFPPLAQYGEFAQVDNGIGVTALLRDLWRDDLDAARAQQQAISTTRLAIQDFGPIPAQKRLLAMQTGDARWANVRPPLDPLSEQRGDELLALLGGNS